MSDRVESWTIVMRRRRRPWWTLWLVPRRQEVVATREGTEDEILASAADLKATCPAWEIELERVTP